MADAARSARSSFKQIGDDAGEMGGRVGRSSLDIRHGIGLVDNTIRGAHSMAMVDFIRLFSDSALVMNALPFAMTAAGFALIAEVVVKGVQAYQAYKLAMEALRTETTKFHTTVQDTFNGLNDKILEAQKETDELSGNHLGALHNELELIDHQSLSELAHAFDTVAKSADTLFGDLKASWYQFGIGSAGAKHALDTFQTQYESLLAQGKDKDASDLLGGTLASAKQVLQLQQELKAQSSYTPTGNTKADDASYNRIEGEKIALKKAGVGWTDKEVESQQALVDALSAQVEIHSKITTLQSIQDNNARTQTAQAMSKQGNGIDSKVADGRARMMADLYGQYQQQVQIVQDGERLTIDATKQGSAERLQAVEDAMRREEADGLQDTAFYKSLAAQKLDVEQNLSDQEAQLKAQMGQEDAEQGQRMGMLKLAAERESLESIRAQVLMSGNERIQAEMQIANQEYEIEHGSLQSQLEALDQFAQDYAAKKQQLNDKIQQLDQQHANQEQASQDKASKNEMGKFTTQQAQLLQIYNQGFAQVITGKQSLLQMMQRIDSQIADSAIQNALKDMEADNMTRERDAAAAARKAFLAGWHFPFPANIIAAPVLAAGAFAAAMAFQDGTDRVPGVGRGDVVPTMLEPGEGVVPGGVMDGLRHVARHGGFDGGQSVTHIHVHQTNHVQALDGDGLTTVLNKHADQLQGHFERSMRRMNK
ncbi:MAG TPA: hypothetical protein VHX20_19350 [Terracidiphilus sp.]|nr:hypothetical protein [Terracidiphilus sp.]